MDPEFALAYERLFREHWWFRVRSLFLEQELARLWPGGLGPVLDVGCGNGLHFPMLRRLGGDPEGLEPDGSVVTPAGRRHGPIHNVPFGHAFRPGRRYAVILMLDVLEHLDDPTAALVRAGELLAPGGRVVVTVPAFRLLWTSHDQRNRHRIRYRRSELVEQADRAGLEVCEFRYLFAWLVPVKLTLRLIESVLGPSSVHQRVPPPRLNRLFFALSSWELRMWRHGPPFGCSLYVVLASPIGVGSEVHHSLEGLV